MSFKGSKMEVKVTTNPLHFDILSFTILMK